MIKIRVSVIYKLFLFLFLFTIVSRGFFELFFEKKMAFLIQALSIIVFVLLSLSVFKIKLESKYFMSQLMFCLVFLCAVGVSILLTVYLQHGGAPIFYSAIIMFLAVTFVFISSFSYKQIGIVDLGKIIVLLIIILFSIALYEQITKTLMPGAWWYHGKIRPASLTGSKQHYSIILAILSLFAFQYWFSLRKFNYLFGFIVGVVGVVLSLTRSGAMILVLAFLPFIFYKLYTVHLVKMNTKLLVFISSVLGLTLISSVLYFDIDFFLDRIISSLDVKSPGNDERVEAWMLGLDMLWSSNMFFGEYTGVVTNATRTITSTKSFVVESGTLQMILNFGFIGFFAFYLMLINIYSRIKQKHIFMVFVLFSCIISTVVYQSIETIPFIILLSFIPLISNDIRSLSNREE